MKRLLLLALALVFVAMPAMALSLTFQDTSEFGAYMTCSGTGTCSWIQSATGGNNYVQIGGTAYIVNIDPMPTTYAAITSYGSWATIRRCVLYNSAGGVLWTSPNLNTGIDGRWEMKMIGGAAYIYANGVLQASSGALGQNPSYVAWGGIQQSAGNYWRLDDYVLGTTETRTILGSPEQGYNIRKDMLTGTCGFYNAAGVLISSYNMTTTWGIGDTTDSQTIILKEWSAPNNAGTKATTAGSMAGTIAWPIYEDICINPNAPYGYYITTVTGSGEVSSVVPYFAYGASVTFNRDTYARGDTASIDWSVDAGGYWDPATYNYRVDTIEMLTGTVIDSHTVTTQTGSASVTFTDSDNLGVYYAAIIATPIAGGSDIYLNGDTCELTAYLVISGYVNDAETTARIPVSKIKFYSNGLADYINTVDGNYTTTEPFLSGSQMIINVTATGYRPYEKNFTPVSGAGIYLNFSLVPSNPVVHGIALGGVVREGDGEGSSSSIPPKPVPNATVNIYNRTYGESYTVEANMAGYYIADRRVPITLTNHRLYNIIPSKTGYRNFSIYSAVVSGS